MRGPILEDDVRMTVPEGLSGEERKKYIRENYAENDKWRMCVREYHRQRVEEYYRGRIMNEVW